MYGGKVMDWEVGGFKGCWEWNFTEFQRGSANTLCKIIGDKIDLGS